MRLKIYNRIIIYPLILFFLLAPVLDSIACDICKIRIPLQGETTVNFSKSLIKDARSDNSPSLLGESEQKSNNIDFCSLCANSILGSASLELLTPAPIDQFCGAVTSSPHLTIYLFIFKPPQNFLA